MRPCCVYVCFPVFEGSVWNGVRGGREQIKRGVYVLARAVKNKPLELVLYYILVFLLTLTEIFCNGWLGCSLVELKPRQLFMAGFIGSSVVAMRAVELFDCVVTPMKGVCRPKSLTYFSVTFLFT